ncbi:secretin N-terminal domain-containing protein [Thermodesulfobacteriota bacterium]
MHCRKHIPSFMKRNKRAMLLFMLFVSCLFLLAPGPVSTARADLVDQLKGKPASIRGEELQVAILLRAIARQAGINIFVADTIDDTITIDMDHLTLYEIFQVIVTAKQLHYTEKDSILYIEKKSDYQEEQKDILTHSMDTKFGNAQEFIPQLSPLLSKNGTLTAAGRGNRLIIRDRAENINKIEAILASLDKPRPQVHIEAKIVTTTQEARRRLGIKWGYDNNSSRRPIGGNIDLSVENSSNINIGFIKNNLDLNIELMALQKDDMLQILSSPRILVLDGKEAQIKQGKEVPYVSTSGDVTSTSFREANLSLKVTPTILHDQFIILDVRVTNDSVDQATSGGEPLINKQEISTQLFLENNITVVIGGILLKTSDHQKSGVPVLSSIPLVGNLFKNSEDVDELTELLVFITPTIIDFQTAMSGLPAPPPPVQENSIALHPDNPGGEPVEK